MSGNRLLLTSYMAASAVFVAVGGALLYMNSLVPVFLTYATSLAVILVSITAYYVYRGSKRAINFGILLSLAAIISSASSPSHLHAMGQIFGGGLISALDVLEVLGFYLFPALYIATVAVGRRESTKNKSGQAD